MATCIINQHSIQLNGEMIPLPPGRRGKRTTTTVINDHIYVNGYEHIGGKWKRTLKAIWHHLF